MDAVSPVLLSLLAGSATGIGGLLVVFFGGVGEKAIGFTLGFAGGVMLVVSFLDLYVEALGVVSLFEVVVCFGAGALFMMAVDLTLPHIEFGLWEDGVGDRRLFNSGLMIAVGMGVHNLPEGVVVSAGFAHVPELGLLVALMICLHNIPEGIATVTPLVKAGVGRWRAVGIATVSGLVEPLGAVIGLMVIQGLGGGSVVGWGLGFAAGVMTYVTLDELIPVAHQYCSMDHKHMVSTGIIVGTLFGQLISLLVPL
jgi:ZIP family zinc transporter